MTLRKLSVLAAALTASGLAGTAEAQKMCRATPPPGTYAACGNAPGYYRPQPHTIRGYRVIRNPGTYYAPVGPRQKYWHQYDPETNRYFDREPNPYNERGRLSPGRTARHLWETRVRPRFRRDR